MSNILQKFRTHTRHVTVRDTCCNATEFYTLLTSPSGCRLPALCAKKPSLERRNAKG